MEGLIIAGVTNNSDCCLSSPAPLIALGFYKHNLFVSCACLQNVCNIDVAKGRFS